MRAALDRMAEQPSANISTAVVRQGLPRHLAGADYGVREIEGKLRLSRWAR
jgi:hypothetical protein